MEIETSARLHLSLIDLNGSEGRLDGGIGITLQNPTLNMECVECEEDSSVAFNDNISTSNNETITSKILDATFKMKKYLNIETNYHFKINKLYPLHHGLGLGTQLALSTAKLISSLNEVEMSSVDLAKIIQRGGTSGIGVYSFDKGGMLIDGGHKKDIKKEFLPSSASLVSPPPLIARYDFPKEWNIILITPHITSGASGRKEIDIFQKYSPINILDVQQISYLTLMKLMPSVVERDIESFGDAINKIQSIGFKKIERDLQDSSLNDLINHMKKLNIPAVGMSSFGPTCFGITEDNVKLLRKEIEEIAPNSEIMVTKGKNHGSILK